MQIFLLLPFLLQMISGRPQQQQQLVTQMLGPSQAATLGPDALSPTQGPATSLAQILFNLLNYKLQWLNQLAGHLTGHSPGQGNSFKPALLGALGALGSGAPGAGTSSVSHPHHGYPFMTTLVTTLSGHAPTVPGITIAGAPVNHLAYPGAPTAAPLQDFHWVPPYATESPQAAKPQTAAAPVQTQPVPQTAAATASATKPTASQSASSLPPALGTVPVIPTIDDVPLQTVVQPVPAASTAPATPATPAALAAPATSAAPAALAAPATSAAPAAPAAPAAAVGSFEPRVF